MGEGGNYQDSIPCKCTKIRTSWLLFEDLIANSSSQFTSLYLIINTSKWTRPHPLG